MLKSLFSSLFKLISWLPLPIAHAPGRLVGFLFGHVVRHHRKDAFEALKRSIPELAPKQRRRIINTMYRYQGMNGAETIWYSMRGLKEVAKAVEVEGIKHLQEAKNRGKGVLVLTAHIGNFELMLMAATLLGYRLSVVVKRIKNRAIHAAIKQLRTRKGISLLYAKQAYRNCLKALHRNEAVGMIMDQNMIRKEGVFVDFFGRPACTSPGLAYMAAHSHAPVIPVFIYRKPKNGFRMKILPALEPPSDRSDETIRAATQAYTKKIEDAVREAPEQWIWMHRRWKTRPLEEQSTTER